MTGHDGSDPRLDLHDEAAAGGGPDLMPATDEHATDPAARGWVSPQSREAPAGGAADGRPTPGAQIRPGPTGADGKIWPDSTSD